MMRLLLLAVLWCSLAHGLVAQARWTKRSPPTAPAARAEHSLGYDRARDAIVLFGGTNGQAVFGDTWEWTFDASQTTWGWTLRNLTGPARHAHAMAFHTPTQRMLLFGGFSSSTLGDTWEWDGTTWSAVSTTMQPPPRAAHAMAFDPLRNQIVLFGGADPAQLPLGDTWLWDGSTWRSVAVTGPSARSGHAMTWDPVRGVVLLFGGRDATNLNDTWEWDGTTWARRTPPTTPPAGTMLSMTYDEVRLRAIVHGLPTPFTWEWDGATWQAAIVPSPGTRSATALAYHPSGGRTLLFGGNAPVPNGDTWEFFYAPTAQWRNLGSGCAGTAGTLTLTNRGGGLPWYCETPFVVDLAPMPTSAAVVLFVGGSKTQWMGLPLPYDLTGAGMPGCSLIASPDILVPVPNVGGSAPVAISLPKDPTIIGKTVYLQGLVLDSGANAAGAVTSDGGQMTPGSR